MTDIIEIMARAIALQNPDLWDGDVVKWRYCTKEARAALTAVLDHMQEPSERMMNEAECEFQNHSMGRDPEAMFLDLWQAMTDQYRKEALND